MKKKKTKLKYRIRNWNQYNKALVNRGSLTLWFDTSAINTWLNLNKSARRGRNPTYSDAAIACMLMVREVYHLPLRALEGLICSLMHLLDIDLPVPDYSTLSRRARKLKIELQSFNKEKNKIKHLLVDSSGMKVFGEGEWKVKTHGWVKHRTWRKLHIAVDAETQQVTAALISHRDKGDGRILPTLLKKTEGEIKKVCADGAYDNEVCYKAIQDRGAKAIIAPRDNAVIKRRIVFHDRNTNLRMIRKVGIKKWKKRSHYHRRSLVETAFHRLKMLLGDRLRSRKFQTQYCEALIKCAVLNRMTSLGMPDSYAA